MLHDSDFEVGLLVTPDLNDPYVDSICNAGLHGAGDVLVRMRGQIGEVLKSDWLGWDVWWPCIGRNHPWSPEFLSKVNK